MTTTTLRLAAAVVAPITRAEAGTKPVPRPKERAETTEAPLDRRERGTPAAWTTRRRPASALQAQSATLAGLPTFTPMAPDAHKVTPPAATAAPRALEAPARIPVARIPVARIPAAPPGMPRQAARCRVA